MIEREKKKRETNCLDGWASVLVEISFTLLFSPISFFPSFLDFLHLSYRSWSRDPWCVHFARKKYDFPIFFFSLPRSYSYYSSSSSSSTFFKLKSSSPISNNLFLISANLIQLCILLLSTIYTACCHHKLKTILFPLFLFSSLVSLLLFLSHFSWTPKTKS